MKQHGRLARHWIKPGDIRTFVGIAFGACQTKIVRRVVTAMFGRNNMIYLKLDGPIIFSK